MFFSFLCPLFPCLRAGKLLLCACKGQMSCQILSALLRKLQGGSTDEDRHESSQKRLEGGGCSPGRGWKRYRLGCAASGFGLHPAPQMEDHEWPAEPGEALMRCDTHKCGTASAPPLWVPLHIQRNSLGQRVSHWCVPGDHGHSSCAVKTSNFKSPTNPSPCPGEEIWGKSQNFPEETPEKPVF